MQFKNFTPKTEEELCANKHVAENISKVEKEMVEYIAAVKHYITNNDIKIDRNPEDEFTDSEG